MQSYIREFGQLSTFWALETSKGDRIWYYADSDQGIAIKKVRTSAKSSWPMSRAAMVSCSRKSHTVDTMQSISAESRQFERQILTIVAKLLKSALLFQHEQAFANNFI